MITTDGRTYDAAVSDLITSEVPAELASKTLDNLTLLFNASFHWKYFPYFWKVAEIIMELNLHRLFSHIGQYYCYQFY